MKQTDFAKTLTQYLTDFLPGQRNVSPNTIKSYRDTFKQYLYVYASRTANQTGKDFRLASLTVLQHQGFLHWLETSKNVGISTRNQRLAAIHSFFRYAQTENPEILFESQKILGIPFKKRQQQRYTSIYEPVGPICLNSPMHP